MTATITKARRKQYVEQVFHDIEDLKRQIDRKYSYLAALLECIPE